MLFDFLWRRAIVGIRGRIGVRVEGAQSGGVRVGGGYKGGALGGVRGGGMFCVWGVRVVRGMGYVGGTRGVEGLGVRAGGRGRLGVRLGGTRGSWGGTSQGGEV